MRDKAKLFILLTNLFFFIYFGNAYSHKQTSNKFNKSIILSDTNLLHVKHINSLYKNDGKAFLDHIIKYYLDTIADIKYITNRKLLHEIPMVKNDTMSVIFKGKLHEKLYEVKLIKNKFQKNQHNLDGQIANEDTFRYAYIDDQIAYGAYGPVENTVFEFNSIIVKIGNQQIDIPKSQYSNLLTPWFGILEPFFKTKQLYNGVDVWTSLDGEFLYIYIYGGTGGISTYIAKLVSEFTPGFIKPEKY